MLYKIRNIIEQQEIENNQVNIFRAFSMKWVKNVIDFCEKHPILLVILKKIPKSIIYFISQGMTSLVVSDKNFSGPVYDTIDEILGENIVRKYGKKRKDFIVSEIIYQNILQSMIFFFDVLLFCPYFAHYRDFERYYEVEGIEYLDNALKKGNGAILLTAHISNYLFLILYFSLKGYKVNVIMGVNAFLSVLEPLRKCNFKIIPNTPFNSKKVKKIIKNKIDNALNKNEIVVILQDTAFNHYTLIEFFDKLCYTPVGTISLAEKHDSPIIPAFIRSSLTEDYHKITVYPEFPLKKIASNNRKEFLLFNTYRLNKFLERIIKRRFVFWGNIALHHLRKRFTKVSEESTEEPILNIMIDKIKFYKKYLLKSYEPKRNDKIIEKLLDSSYDKLLKLQEIQKSFQMKSKT
ncbi:MAG: hypothetical protein GF329_22540 [Candidatus Lokiarchaeota archaeon]|nr:hypothetical protein [Candidatus Lokiarchaeota archaeon]